MRTINITAICISLLAALSMAGCVCTPAYHPGMSYSNYGGCGQGSVVFDGGCEPCGTPMACAPEFNCGVIEYGGNPCFPPPKIVDCRTSCSNISNGVLLLGRGVLDITAAPFVIVGNALSSGCRYEVLAYCGDSPCVNPCVSPCVSPCSSPCGGSCGSPCSQVVETYAPAGSSGCTSCGNGYSEPIQYDVSSQGRTSLSQPMLYRGNSVIQTSYSEPVTPGVRFVQPR